MYREPHRIVFSYSAAKEILAKLAEGIPVKSYTSYIKGLPRVHCLATQYVASIPTFASHRCAKDLEKMQEIAKACFLINSQLATVMASIQHCIVGCTYSTGPGIKEWASWCNLLIPLSGSELSSTNRSRLHPVVANMVKEEAQYASIATAFFSSPTVELAALLCSDCCGTVEFTQQPSQAIGDESRDKDLFTGLMWRGIEGGSFFNTHLWPICSEFDLGDAFGFSIVACIINDIMGLEHDIIMKEPANCFILAGSMGTLLSPTLEMLSIYTAFNQLARLPEPCRSFYIRYWLSMFALHLLSSRYCAFYFKEDIQQTERNFVNKGFAFTPQDKRKRPIQDCHQALLEIVSQELLSEVRRRVASPKEWPQLLSECFDHGGEGDISLLAATVVACDLETGVLYGLALDAENALPGAKSTVSIMDFVATGYQHHVCCSLV